MNDWRTRTHPLRKKLFDRGFSMLIYAFPMIEAFAAWGRTAFLENEMYEIRFFYIDHISKIVEFHQEYYYPFLISIYGIFHISSSGKIRIGRYLRFHIAQATLFYVVLTALLSTFYYSPLWITNGLLGQIAAQEVIILTMLGTCYSWIFIFYGYYPQIPIFTSGAKLLLQRDKLDIE